MSADAGRASEIRRPWYARIRTMNVKRFAALLLAASAVACGGIVDPSQNRTDNFSGTLQPGGTFIQPFNASKSGEYSISVTSTTPTTTSGVLGVGFGQMVSGSCSPWTLNAYATVGRTGSTGAIQQGSWCAIVYDPGILTTATSFQGWVKHP